MRKINIIYIKNKNIQLSISFIEFILKKSNSLIKIIDNRKAEDIINGAKPINCIFYTKDSNKEEYIEIIFKVFDIVSFHRSIDSFVNAAYDHVGILSEEPYDKHNMDQIKGILKTDCILFDYEEPRDIICFFVKIFFDILTEHRLSNGNKRVATSLLYKLCYYHGFFINNSYENWQNNEEKIIYFVKTYENSRDQEKVKKEIYDWLKENLYIAPNFTE